MRCQGLQWALPESSESRENTRLEKELEKARLIIDVQGKVAGLLGLSLEDGTNS